MPHPKHKKPDDGQAVEKLGRKRYNEELARLQGDLVRLQEAVVRDGLKVLIVFEGRDSAGKGGVNRAGVERVMGFCSEDEALRFLRLVPTVEWAIVDSGIILLKYWLEVGPEEQTRRLQSRINDPRKVWKLSPMDLESYSRWDAHTRAGDDMFDATDTDFAPWHAADSNDKKRARLNIISHLLEQIPYEAAPRKSVSLPERTQPKDAHQPLRVHHYVPATY